MLIIGCLSSVGLNRAQYFVVSSVLIHILRPPIHFATEPKHVIEVK